MASSAKRVVTKAAKAARKKEIIKELKEPYEFQVNYACRAVSRLETSFEARWEVVRLIAWAMFDPVLAYGQIPKNTKIGHQFGIRYLLHCLENFTLNEKEMQKERKDVRKALNALIACGQKKHGYGFSAPPIQETLFDEDNLTRLTWTAHLR